MVLGTFKLVTLLAVLVAVISAVVASFYYEYPREDSHYYSPLDKSYYNAAKKTFVTAVKVGAIAGVVSVLAPSKQGLAMLGGVYVGQQVYDGLSKSELVNKAVKVLDQELNGYLDSYLTPTQPNTDTPKQ
jgi:hypothetical protein